MTKGCGKDVFSERLSKIKKKDIDKAGKAAARIKEAADRTSN